MVLWGSITFAILVVVPLTSCRHLEHNSARKAAKRHEESTADDESSWPLPKSHLRLHSKPPKVLHLKEGSSDVLECQAGGSPLPRIYWLKNGELISKIEDEDEAFEDIEWNHKLNMGSVSSKLYLDCVSMAHEAEYTCIAENDKLRESTTTRVTISSSDDKSCHDKKQYGQAPRIVSWTKTALENQGQDVRVICRAEGDPKPTIKWLDTHEVEIDPESGSKYDTFPNGDLVVRNLKWKDMGNYICVAENTHGSARAEIFVYPATPET